jgi:hypothetical protein
MCIKVELFGNFSFRTTSIKTQFCRTFGSGYSLKNCKTVVVGVNAACPKATLIKQGP